MSHVPMEEPLEVQASSHNVNFHHAFLKHFLEVQEHTSFAEI
jgi:hypothetical protein